MAPHVARVGLLAVFMSSLPAQATDAVWRGNSVATEALASAQPAAAAALRAWSGFAGPRGYRLVLADDGDTLLVLSGTYARRKPKKEHNDVEVMLKAVRGAAACVQRCVAPPAAAPPVVVACVKTVDYPALLQFVAGLDARNQEWCQRTATTVAGFVLSQPLVAAWIEDPSGVDEWHPVNELVHRTAQLLLRRHAGRLPDWFVLGFGWHVEDTVLQSIYCFPHRASFVSAAEHTDWGLLLAHRFKKGRREESGLPPLLTIEELADWRPAADEEWTPANGSMLAFGLVRYLAHERPAAVLPFAQQCHAAIEKGSIVKLSEHEWTTNPAFMIPARQQLELLEPHCPNVLAAATAWLQAKKANERRLTKQ
jgi:hypothetical protein